MGRVGFQVDLQPLPDREQADLEQVCSTTFDWICGQVRKLNATCYSTVRIYLSETREDSYGEESSISFMFYEDACGALPIASILWFRLALAHCDADTHMARYGWRLAEPWDAKAILEEEMTLPLVFLGRELYYVTRAPDSDSHIAIEGGDQEVDFTELKGAARKRVLTAAITGQSQDAISRKLRETYGVAEKTPPRRQPARKARKPRPTNAEETKLLQGIVDSPDAVLPYRRYAEMLLDRGDPQGEFIQVQCDLEETASWQREWWQLNRRQQELLDRHRETWLEPLQGLKLTVGESKKELWEATFRRGLVRKLKLFVPEDFMRVGPALFKAAPLLNAIELAMHHDNDAAVEMPGCEHFSRLESFESHYLIRGLVDAVVNSPHSRQLRQLTILNEWDSDDIGKLARSPNLERIEILNPACDLLNNDVAALSEAKWRLKDLSVRIDDRADTIDAVRVLLSAECLHGVRKLRLRGQLGATGAELIAQSPSLSELETLDIWDAAIGPKGAEALAASPHLKNLRLLNLGGNKIRDRGAKAVAAAHWPRLWHLDLYDNRIKAAGVAAIVNSPYLRQLRYLRLSENKFGPDGAAAIAAATNCHFLSSLIADFVDLEDEGAKLLAEAPLVGRLSTLCIGWNGIGREGLAALLNSPQVSTLLEFRVPSKLDPKDANLFLKTPHLDRAERLVTHFDYPGPTAKSQEKLREKFGDRLKW